MTQEEFVKRLEALVTHRLTYSWGDFMKQFRKLYHDELDAIYPVPAPIRCWDCHFFVYPVPSSPFPSAINEGQCHWCPLPILKPAGDFCGQFKPKTVKETVQP
jgi:hypothetical protein